MGRIYNKGGSVNNTINTTTSSSSDGGSIVGVAWDCSQKQLREHSQGTTLLLWDWNWSNVTSRCKLEPEYLLLNYKLA